MTTFRFLQLVRIGLLLVAAALLSHRGRAQVPPGDTLVFPAAADTYVDAGHQGTNYDSDPRLRGDSSPLRVSYLRFAVTGVAGRTVQQARVRLGVAGAADSGGSIHSVADNTWDAATMNFHTMPAYDPTPLATLGPITLGAVVEFDVSAVVKGDGVYSFAIDTASTNGLDYNSSAAATGQLPQLLLQVPPTGAAPLVTMVQPPDASAFYAGDPVTFQATASDVADGDLSSAIVWVSDLQGPLGTGTSISPTLVQGSHTITASATDRWALTTTATVHVSVGPKPHVNVEPLVAITAPLDRRTFNVGATEQFTAIANDLEDGVLTSGLAWTSDKDGPLGTGSGFSATLSPGTHTITASVTDSGGLTGSAHVTVTVMPPRTTEVLPSADAYVDAGFPTTNYGSALLIRMDANTERDTYIRFPMTTVGTQKVLKAILRLTADTNVSAPSDKGGDVHLLTNTTWSESTVTFKTKPSIPSATVAKMSGAVAAGQVVDFDVTSAFTKPPGDAIDFAITLPSTDGVDYSSREGTAPPKLILTLDGNAPLVSIVAPPNQSIAFTGTPVGFTGTATDVEDGDVASQLYWWSSLDGPLGTGKTVTAPSLSVGAHTINAGVVDADGHYGEAQLSVRVRGANQAPSVAITAPAPGGTTAAGTPTTLTATVTDDFDTDLAGKIQWTSSRGGVLGTGPSLVRTLGEGAHTLTASVVDSDGAGASASVVFTVTPAPPTVSITAPLPNAAFFQNAGVAFTATAKHPTDGDLSSQVRWSSDVDGPLGTGASITPASLTVGPHVVTATVTAANGLSASAMRSVTVRPPNAKPVLTIVAPAANAMLLTGKPVLLSATATDAEDGNLGASIAWTSSIGGKLGTGATVTVPSLAVGTHTITAGVTDHDGTTVTASVQVTVGASMLTFAPIADTYVDAGAPTKAFGTTTGFQASSSPLRQGYLRFTVSGIGGFAVNQAILRLTVGAKSGDAAKVGGTIQSFPSSAWSETTTTYNTRPAVTGPVLATLAKAVKANQVVDFDVTAGLAGDGTYNFALVSTSTDYVQYQSREGTKKPVLLVTLKQNTAPVVTITAPASGTIANPGTSIAFTGTATDAESGNLSASIAWSSDLDGPLGTGASITHALTPGVHTITASVTDSSGATASATTTVVTDQPPVVKITAPAAIVFTSAKPYAFAATALDPEDGDLAAKLQWTSSVDGPLGTGASFTHDLTVGTHTITASVTDVSGVTGRAQATVRVREPNTAPRLTITAPASGGSTPAGTPVTLAATVTDDFDRDLAGKIAWSSTRGGALGTGATLTRTLVEGAQTLTASVTDSDGASTSATVSFTVAPTPPVVTITAPLPGATIFQNAATLTASATDATDGDLSPSIKWTSNVDGALGTGASIKPATLSVGTHTITATATDAGGLSAQATRTLTVRPPNVPPVVTITAPLDGAALLSGKPTILNATAIDREDGDSTPAIKWTSSLSGPLGTGGMLNLASLAVGAHTLTATVVDHDGDGGSASVHVTVSASSLSIVAAADTYVDAGTPTKNFGTATGIQASGSPIRQALLRFPVTGVGSFAVDKAILRLTVGTASSDGSKLGGSVVAVAGDWSEAATIYTNRPSVGTTAIATHAVAVKTKEVVDFDVTSAMGADATYDFAVVNTSTDPVLYQSREGATKPVLLITLKQNTAPVVTITGPTPPIVTIPGNTLTFTATATDAESGDLGARIAWSSNLDGALGTGPSLTVSSLHGGVHTITARVTDPSGASAEAHTTVAVDNPPAVTMLAPVDGGSLFTNTKPYAFSATATDVEDGDLRTRLQWTSSLDGPLGTGASFTHDLRVGTHVITASVTDAAGVTGQAQATVRVRAPNTPPVLHVTSPTVALSIAAGTPLSLEADAHDDFDGDLTDAIAWSSTLDGPLGTGGALTLTLRHEGAHTLTATVTDSDGVSVSSTVAVTITPTPPAVTISSPAVGALIFANIGATFGGTAIDATDGDLSSKLVWTSSLDGQIGTGASFATTALRVGTHTITASVKDAGNLTGSAQRTVVIKPADTFPTVQINAPTDGTGLFAGTPLVFDGTANDAEDGLLSGIIQWSSNIDGALGHGRTVTATALSPGVHVITASVTDLKGATTTATITVVVSPRTLSFAPVADTTVDGSSPAAVFGTSPTLAVAGTPVKQTYLRFVVTGVSPPFSVRAARLRLTADSSAAAASVAGGTLATIVGNNLDWSEASTTFASKPTIDGSVLASQGAVTAGQTVDFDVTSAITTNATISFALTSSAADDVIYRSREATSGQPQLLIDLHGPGDPTVTITSPSAGSILSAGSVASFSATAQDAHGTNLSGTIAWTSSIDGALGTGGSITHALSVGTHTITATATDSSSATGSATTMVTVAAATTGSGLGVRDFTYPASIENGTSNEATAQKPESKLWFVDGLWWATLYNSGAGAHHIYKFNVAANAWGDTGVLVDQRPQARQDVLWDGHKLYMVSRFAGSPAQATMLRFSYVSSGKTWSMDAGFPVNIGGGGALALTIAKDSTGMLWSTYVVNKQVYVQHSVGSDSVWSTPVLLGFAESINLQDDGVHKHDISGVIAIQGKVGVFWSNQTLHKDFFAVHRDGDDPATWSLETAGQGGDFADDHFNLKLASDGRLFAMVKTSYNSNGNILDGLIVRSPSGTWSSLFNICLFDYAPTRELILLDETNRRIYAFYSLGHGSIYYKGSNLDTIAFPDGPGTPFISSTSVTDINNPMSTKQNLTPEMGMLVMASSRGDTSYWHNYMSLAAALAATP